MSIVNPTEVLAGWWQIRLLAADARRCTQIERTARPICVHLRASACICGQYSSLPATSHNGLSCKAHRGIRNAKYPSQAVQCFRREGLTAPAPPAANGARCRVSMARWRDRGSSPALDRHPDAVDLGEGVAAAIEVRQSHPHGSRCCPGEREHRPIVWPAALFF